MADERAMKVLFECAAREVYEELGIHLTEGLPALDKGVSKYAFEGRNPFSSGKVD